MVLVYQTEPFRDLCIVLSGTLKASLLDEDGNELALAVFKPGEQADGNPDRHHRGPE